MPWSGALAGHVTVSMSEGATDPDRLRTVMVRLAAVIILIVVLGTPLVAYTWETVNQLLSGHIEVNRVMFTVPVVILLVVLFRLMQKLAGRLEVEAVNPSDRSEEPRQ